MPQRGERSDLTARMQFRVTEVTRERAELAAAELEMPFAEWCRAIFEAAVDAHFDDRTFRVIEVDSHTTPGVKHRLTLDAEGHVVACECPGWERLGRCRHAQQMEAYGPEGYDAGRDEHPDDFDQRVAAARAEAGIDPEPAIPSRAPAVVHPGIDDAEHQAEAPKPNPRECPHLPQWRVGSMCSAAAGGCGGRVAGGMARIPMRAGLRR